MPLCIHCDFYNNIPEGLRKVIPISNTQKIYKRYCRHVEQDVTSESLSCAHFTPYAYFWCNIFTYRLHLLQCLNRQKKKMEGCMRCGQAEDILDVARGRDLYAHFGVDRKIHTVLKRKKPKLRRRKA
ncbi:MAG: hypothetical protein AM326_01595 [Candidatus Thorarchaeota archaeon SMTZ-45]|nr:MAG: hypothetical protein AM326_01595 [Candidatus Thorarchaeota archaeon SMTZ-45]